MKNCLTCQKEISEKYGKVYCSGRCQREYLNYKKGKKKFNEIFVDLRGKRKNTKKNKRLKGKRNII